MRGPPGDIFLRSLKLAAAADYHAVRDHADVFGARVRDGEIDELADILFGLLGAFRSYVQVVNDPPDGQLYINGAPSNPRS